MRIVILLLLVCFALWPSSAATIWIPNPDYVAGSHFWIEYKNVEKWVVKNNGTLEFYHNNEFHVESLFKIED